MSSFLRCTYARTRSLWRLSQSHVESSRVESREEIGASARYFLIGLRHPFSGPIPNNKWWWRRTVRIVKEMRLGIETNGILVGRKIKWGSETTTSNRCGDWFFVPYAWWWIDTLHAQKQPAQDTNTLCCIHITLLLPSFDVAVALLLTELATVATLKNPFNKRSQLQ